MTDTDNGKKTYYGVLQIGCSFFGFGEFADEAVEDAKEWVNEPDELEEQIEECRGFDGDMTIVEVPQEIYDLRDDGIEAYELWVKLGHH